MSDPSFDAVVVGAGPAGSTAAIQLARSGRRVALLDRMRFPREKPVGAWLNAKVATLLAALDVPPQHLLDDSIREVTFNNVDFTKRAKPALAAPGYLIERGKFEHALVQAAAKAGVEVLEGRHVRRLQLKEKEVVVESDQGSPVAGRLLLLATGHEAELVNLVGVSRDRKHTPAWCAQVDGPLTTPRSESAVALVLGLDRRSGFGMCCLSKTWFSVGVTLFGGQDQVRERLIMLCKTAHERGVVPMDLSPAAAAATVVSSPASAGLDMETHVGKHSLVFGDAGGFVSAASNEGIYPGMWSAQLAAEVAETALQAAKNGRPTQDELMRFDSLWRIQMADYLRSPHTDIQFILPLIFSNQPMADRMGAAFFSGENI